MGSAFGSRMHADPAAVSSTAAASSSRRRWGLAFPWFKLCQRVESKCEHEERWEFGPPTKGYSPDNARASFAASGQARPVSMRLLAASEIEFEEPLDAEHVAQRIRPDRLVVLQRWKIEIPLDLDFEQ